MARIAFFSERLPPNPDPITDFSFDLMCSLADQGHDIRVYSTYEPDQTPPSHPRIQISRPFRKWSWLELPLLLPMLMSEPPEIIHLIQPRAGSLKGFTNAMAAIPGFAPMIGRPPVITSFYDLRADAFKKHRMVLASSDAVTVSNRSQSLLMNSWLSEIGRRAQVTILPILQTSSPDLASSENIPEALSRFFIDHEKIIFVPGDISEHSDPKQLMHWTSTVLDRYPQAAVLFGGGWGDLSTVERRELTRLFESTGHGARVFISGPLVDQTVRFSLHRAYLVFAASLPAQSLRLMQTVRASLQSSSVLILSEAHVAQDPMPWQDGVHAFIATDQNTWGQKVAQALESEDLVQMIRDKLPEFARQQALDQPGNVVSRIYAQLIESRFGR